jgi:hypothetical protein
MVVLVGWQLEKDMSFHILDLPLEDQIHLETLLDYDWKSHRYCSSGSCFAEEEELQCMVSGWKFERQKFGEQHFVSTFHFEPCQKES